MTVAQVQPQTHIIERFKDFYRHLETMPLDDIGQVYDTNITFRDPIHEIRGLTHVHQYMTKMCTGVTEGRFEFLDQVVTKDTAYIKWNMYFVHPKFGPKTIQVRGISHIQFDDKIFFHEDVYDMGEMVYEHVPVLGGFVGWLKKRLGDN